MEYLADYLSLLNHHTRKEWLEKFPHPFLLETGAYNLEQKAEKTFHTSRINRAQLEKALREETPSHNLPEARVFPLKPDDKIKTGDNFLILIGREIGNQVILSSPLVSKLHAYISLNTEKRRYFIRDAGSTNGTMLNRKEISYREWHPLKNGDMITFSARYSYLFYENDTFFDILSQIGKKK